MSTGKQLAWVVVVVVIAVGAFWWWSSTRGQVATTQPVGNSQTSTPSSQQGATLPSGSGTGIPTSVTVTYNGSSFSPADARVAQGGTVTWISTGGDMWIASDPHDLHNGYDGTTMEQHCASGYTGVPPFDECAGGTSYSFTFNKVGVWGYHDHLNDDAVGSVTVVAQ
ncbi:MAG TPA: hypothetical protein VMH91_04300 [Candidatus Paceibacterota bacterium]|nr:hypothetical protein [Candidatus Paceibacterota bacterium]